MWWVSYILGAFFRIKGDVEKGVFLGTDIPEIPDIPEMLDILDFSGSMVFLDDLESLDALLYRFLV